MAELIYTLDDFDKYTNQMQNKIRKAVNACAFKIRDNARKSLVSDAQSTYTHHTGNMNDLIEGIQIGKNKNNKIAIHGFGTKAVYDSYKTRFFILGTIVRTQSKKRGVSLKKPFSKGYIKPLNTLEKEIQKSGNILQQYVNNAIHK